MSAPAGDGDPTAVASTAVGLLAGREHTRLELRRKLERRYASGPLIDAVLDDLEQRRLLSNERFVEAYVTQRVRKGYGPLRIRAELAERGVEGELVARWLGDGQWDWAALLEKSALRRFGDHPVADMPGLAKQGRFLEQRGFPSSLVRRYLDQVRGF